MRKMKKRIVSIAAGLLAAVSMLSVQAFAAGKIETDKNSEMTIHYKYEDEKVSNVEFELYRIADVSEFGVFTVTEEFEQYQIDLGDYKGSAWNELASTLDGYISRDAFKPEGPKTIDSGKTDKDGILVFPNTQESLKPGLYFLSGENVKRGDYRYSCDPAIIRIPVEDTDANEWDYEIDVFPKCDRKYMPDDSPKPATVSRKVLKRWNDNGYEADRPDSIDVTLLKDGEEYDSVTLDDSNNWSYTWDKLDSRATWKVTEDVPEGYTVSITRQGITFLVVNKKTPPSDPPPGNPPEERPPIDTPPDDNPPRFGVLGEYDENMPFGLLPQTGTTWWLAAALAGAGMLLLALGVVLKRKA